MMTMVRLSIFVPMGGGHRRNEDDVAAVAVNGDFVVGQVQGFFETSRVRIIHLFKLLSGSKR